MSRIYIHEVIDVVGTRRADYQQHMTANWVPEAGPLRRQRCFGVFTLVGSTGRWPQVVNIWEYDSWADLAHNFDVELSAPGHRDPMLAEWWDEAAAMRTGGLDRVLIAHDDAPGVAEWESKGGTGAVGYLQEIVRCPVGDAREVLDTLVHEAAEDHRRFGLELAGAWRTALRADDEVVVLWALPDWERWAAYEEAADGGEVEFLHLWQRVGGKVLDRRRTLLVDAELSPLRTGRQPTADDRRPLHG